MFPWSYKNLDVFPSSTMNKRQKLAISSLSITLIPYLDGSSSRMKDAAKFLAPIGGSQYVHMQNEIQRKYDAELTLKEKRCNKSVALKRIQLACQNVVTPPLLDMTDSSDMGPVSRSYRKCTQRYHLKTT